MLQLKIVKLGDYKDNKEDLLQPNIYNTWTNDNRFIHTS